MFGSTGRKLIVCDCLDLEIFNVSQRSVKMVIAFEKIYSLRSVECGQEFDDAVARYLNFHKDLNILKSELSKIGILFDINPMTYEPEFDFVVGTYQGNVVIKIDNEHYKICINTTSKLSGRKLCEFVLKNAYRVSFGCNWNFVPTRHYGNSRKESVVSKEPKSIRYHKVSKLQKSLFLAIETIYSSQVFDPDSRISPQKEFDDCISRFLNSENPNPKLLHEELLRIGIVTTINPLKFRHKRKVKVGMCNGAVAVSVDDNVYFINSCKNHVKYLKSRKISDNNICEIILTHFNMRSSSGTNWSPIESKFGVAKFSKQYTVIECFASPFNNYETFHKLDNKRGKSPVSYVLTKSKCDDVLPEIKGSWPTGVYDLISNTITGPVMLLVNVPFTEDILISALKEVQKILETYPDREIRIRTCLPDWPDIYERSDIKELFEKWNYTQQTYTESKEVRNFNLKKPIRFKFVVGDMVRI